MVVNIENLLFFSIRGERVFVVCSNFLVNWKKKELCDVLYLELGIFFKKKMLAGSV